ncbi:MAG: hypothetical protein P4L31_07690 [Candidatus Babeliales bacterium]|nr:hypothetical protein [Candidatus Babeliales bacterium]
MTVGKTRHTIYRDWDKKVQKEVHGNKTSFSIDNDKRIFKTLEEFETAYNLLQNENNTQL